MKLEFGNARVVFSRDRHLMKHASFRSGRYKAHVLGMPQWLVDHKRLDYETDQGLIAAELARAASAYLHDPAGWPRLATLSGSFMILVEKQGLLEKVITSDCLPNTVYYRGQSGRAEITDDPWPHIRAAGPLDWRAYSLEDLAYFDAKKTCRPSRTLFKGLRRFQPATIYRMQGGGLKRRKAVHPLKTDAKKLTPADFMSVVGKQTPRGRYTLAYSTGVDSHYMLNAFAPQIDQVCTVYYSGPFQDPERTLEAGAAVVNAVEAAKPLDLVPADLGDASGVKYLSDGVSRDPFACHYTFSMYNLFRTAKSKLIMTGQNADTVQWFGLTSRMPAWKLPLPSPYRNYRWEWQRAQFRAAVARSYGRMVNPGLIDRRLFYGLYPDFGKLVEPHGYWPIMYFKMINNMTSGNTAIFRNAAAYFGKKVFFPFIEPLVLYVSAYMKRPLHTMFDPKRSLRRRYKCLRHTAVPHRVPPGEPHEKSAFYQAAAAGLDRISPSMRREIEARTKVTMARVFLFEMIRRAVEGGPAPLQGRGVPLVDKNGASNIA